MVVQADPAGTAAAGATAITNPYCQPCARPVNASSTALSEAAKDAIEAARGQLVIEPALAKIGGADRPAVESILKGSLAESMRTVLLLATFLALSAAGAGAFIPQSADVDKR